MEGLSVLRHTPFIRNLKISHYLIVLFLLLSFAINGIITFIFYEAASKQVMLDIKRRLHDIVAISSQQIDGDLHHQLIDLTLWEQQPPATTTPPDLISQQPPTHSAQNSTIYLVLKQRLQKIRDISNDIHFIYTMRTTKDLHSFTQDKISSDGPKIMFMVDAESDPAQMANLGDIYTDASPLLMKHFFDMKGPLIENELYRDQWGTWLSGYAPFFDGKGQRAGVLGVDISAETVSQYQKHILLKSLIIFLMTLPLVVTAAFLLGRWIGNPMVMMQKGAEAIASGHLDHRLHIPTGQELSILAKSMNHMAESLQQEQRNLNRMIFKYRNIFENATEGIFQTTPQGRLLTANSAFVKLLGYSSFDEMQQSIDHHIAHIYQKHEDRRHIIKQLEKEGRITGVSVGMKKKDNTEFMVELNAHLCHYGDQNGEETVIEGTLRDITQRIEKERAEREKEAALASSRAKSEFLANMSHEIRTPLNAVMGLTDLMGRTPLTDVQAQYLKKITISSRGLLAVINDILDFSKIEAGRLDLENAPFSLYDLMANISEMFAFRADEKGLEFLIAIDETAPTGVIGDAVRLGQVLINLVGNALKFTEQGEIVVKVTHQMIAERSEEEGPDKKKETAYTESTQSTEPIKSNVSTTSITFPDDSTDEAPQTPETTDLFTFSVEDTGIGIPEDRLEALFDSFTQADGSTTRKYGGTGLGLTISRRLVRLMGGDITVTSTPQKGSTFSFTVPLARQPEKHQMTLDPPRDLRGLNVLIVDDNRTSLEILAGIIQSFQMEAITVSSGEAALETLTSRPADDPFDLVLMDWKMPTMNGLEAARKIKLELALDKTPIVCMVSGHGREDLIQQADRKFLDAFLHKPVNQSFLFDTIMELFGRHDALVTKSTDAPLPSMEMLTNGQLQGKQILLVEDNEINREVAMEWLKSAGIDVDVAVNGKEALIYFGIFPDEKPSHHNPSPDHVQLLQKSSPPSIFSKSSTAFPDAVLMDIQMPKMDGFEATGHIRQDSRFQKLPIIAMTAHALKGDREKCLDAGMDDYVTKPIDPAMLFQTLAKWIATSSHGDDEKTMGTLDVSEPSTKNSSSPFPSPKPPSSSSDGAPHRTASPEGSTPPPAFEIPGIDVAKGLFRSNHNETLYLKLIKSFVRDFRNAEDEILTLLNNRHVRQADPTKHEKTGPNNGENSHIEEGDDPVPIIENARLIAHSVKGVSANIGAEALSSAAAALESAIMTLKERLVDHNAPVKPTDTTRNEYPGTPNGRAFKIKHHSYVKDNGIDEITVRQPFCEELHRVVSGIDTYLSSLEKTSAEAISHSADDVNGKKVEFEKDSVQNGSAQDSDALLAHLDGLETLLDDDLGAARDTLESIISDLKQVVDPALCDDLMDAVDDFDIDEAANFIQTIIQTLK